MSQRWPLVRGYAAGHPFSVSLALAATAASVWLLADADAFAAISIAQVTRPAVGWAWLVTCGAGGALTLLGIARLDQPLEAVGLGLLAAALAAQALGTALRFGGRSIFPALVFTACTIGLLVRVRQAAVVRQAAEVERAAAVRLAAERTLREGTGGA